MTDAMDPPVLEAAITKRHVANMRRLDLQQRRWKAGQRRCGTSSTTALAGCIAGALAQVRGRAEGVLPVTYCRKVAAACAKAMLPASYVRDLLHAREREAAGEDDEDDEDDEGGGGGGGPRRGRGQG